MTSDDDLVRVLAWEYGWTGRLDAAERRVSRALAQLRGTSYAEARFMVRRARVALERLLDEMDDLPA